MGQVRQVHVEDAQPGAVVERLQRLLRLRRRPSRASSYRSAIVSASVR